MFTKEFMLSQGTGFVHTSTSASGVACLDLISCGQSQHRCLPHISIIVLSSTVRSSPDPSRSWCHVLALQNFRSNKHLFVTQTQYFLKATKRNKALIVQGPLDLVRASLACTAEQVSEESLCRYWAGREVPCSASMEPWGWSSAYKYTIVIYPSSCHCSMKHSWGRTWTPDPPASILQELGIQACVLSPLLHPCFGSYSISHAVPAHRCLSFSHEYSSLLFLTLCSGTLHYFWKTLKHPFPLFLDSPPYRICRHRCTFYEGISLRTRWSLSRKTHGAARQPGDLRKGFSSTAKAVA